MREQGMPGSQAGVKLGDCPTLGSSAGKQEVPRLGRTHPQAGQLHAQQDSLFLPATGKESLQCSSLERPLSALPSTCPELFCLALKWEVTFLAAFILHLAISGPVWHVLIQVSDATCSSTSAQLRGSFLRPAVFPCMVELG